MKHIYSLRTKLAVCFSLLLIFASLIICMIYFFYVQKSITRNLVATFRSNVEYMLNNTDGILKQCESFSDWIFLNRDFDKTLLRDYDREIFNYNMDVYSAKKVLSNGVSSTAIGNQILSILLSGTNGVEIKYGDEANYISEELLNTEEWFLQGKESSAVIWSGIQKNPSTVSVNEYVIPLIRSVTFVDNGKYVGWQLINFSTSILSSPLDHYTLGTNDYLLLLDQNMKCIYSNRPGHTGDDFSELFSPILTAPDRNGQVTDFQGEKKLIVWSQSDYSGFYIIQMTDYQVIQQESLVVLRLTVMLLIGATLLGFFAVMLISNTLTKPLSKVMEHIRGIAKKDFDPVPEIEGDDEIGILGKEVNSLGTTVKNLLEEAKEHEKTKKALEFKVLQNQINPHFVYNALNSIKLMAELQRANGICSIATALGELLRETAKGTSDEISIERELYLLQRYIDIQKVRKKGLIRLEVHVAPSILHYKIPKFLLQPIVENAVIHGLSAKKGLGKILIEGYIQNDKIKISITDNGIGIPEQKLNQLLSEDTPAAQSEPERYTSVGLKNTDQRIKLNYGEGYGLKIESCENEYTKIQLTLPLIP